jgi:hypothetical protein
MNIKKDFINFNIFLYSIVLIIMLPICFLKGRPAIMALCLLSLFWFFFVLILLRILNKNTVDNVFYEEKIDSRVELKKDLYLKIINFELKYSKFISFIFLMLAIVLFVVPVFYESLRELTIIYYANLIFVNKVLILIYILIRSFLLIKFNKYRRFLFLQDYSYEENGGNHYPTAHYILKHNLFPKTKYQEKAFMLSRYLSFYDFLLWFLAIACLISFKGV